MLLCLLVLVALSWYQIFELDLNTSAFRFLSIGGVVVLLVGLGSGSRWKAGQSAALCVLVAWIGASPQEMRLVFLATSLLLALRLRLGDSVVGLVNGLSTLTLCALLSVVTARNVFGYQGVLERIGLVAVAYLLAQGFFARPWRRADLYESLSLTGIMVVLAWCLAENNFLWLFLCPVLLQLPPKATEPDRTSIDSPLQTDLSQIPHPLTYQEQRQRLSQGLELCNAEPTRPQALHTLMATFRVLVTFDKLAYLRQNDDLWEPLLCLGPEAELFCREEHRAAVKSFLQTRWAERTVWRRNQEEPILLEDRSVAVIPVADDGLLYLGRITPVPFGEAEVENLLWLVDTAEVFFLALGKEAERETSPQGLWKEKLGRHLDLLQKLQGGSERIGSTIEKDELIPTVREVLANLLAHDEGLLSTGEELVSWSTTSEFGGFRQDVVRELERSVGSPILYGDIRHVPSLSVLHPTASSLLFAPIRTQGTYLGCIILVAIKPEAFSKEHRDILSTLAVQIGLALTNAANFQRVMEAHEALERSQAKLVVAGKLGAVGQLAAGLAHEMNTPLGVVKLSAQSLERAIKAGKSEVAGEKLNRLQRATEKMAVLVNKLLHYSRQSSEPRTDVIDLKVLVTDTLEFLKGRFAADGVEIETDFESNATVMGHPEELQQVLTNLLLNARDAGGGTSSPIVIRVFENGDQGCFSVTDEGSGISEQDLPRVLEPFFTTKPVGEGTGLGLSVSHEIVKAHGGELEVDSQAGEGSCFTVRLPRWVG